MFHDAIAAYKEFWAGALAAVFLLGTAGRIFRARLPLGSNGVGAAMRSLERVVHVGVALAVPLVILEALYYVVWPGYIDHTEPYIVSVAWAGGDGMGIYPDSQSPLRSAVPYGPLLYQISGFFLRTLGPSIIASKLAGGIALALTMGFLVTALRWQLGSFMRALLYAGIPAIAFILFAPFPFSARADSLILTGVSATLVLSLLRPSGFTAVLLGAVLGCLANLKLHAPIYALPALGYFLGRTPVLRRDLVLIAIAAAVSFAIPFLSDAVSISNYVVALRVQARMGLGFGDFLHNLTFAAAIAAPLAWALASAEAPLSRALKSAILGFAAGLAFVTIVAAKPGAGAPHLLPEVVNLVFLLASLTAREPPKRAPSPHATLRACLTLAATLVVLPEAIQVERWVAMQLSDFRRARQEVTEVESILRQHPGESIAMGYGGEATYPLSHLGVLLAFHGIQPRLVAAALMDFRAAGEPVLSASTYDDLAHCNPRIWLIPHGDEPFSLHSFYDHRLLFPQEFRQSFAAHYGPEENEGYFDLWICRGA